MLGNFFKPKWLHKDAKVRIQAINSLAGDSVELIKLAQTDPDMSVRMEAVVRLAHLPTLVQLGHTSGSIGERARQRLIGLAATDHHHDHLLADVFHWLQNPTLLRSIARDSMRGVKLRHQAIGSLNDEDMLFDIANTDPSKEIQFLAASRISDIEKLKTLEKSHGKNNKRLRQLFKERSEQLQQEQQRQQHIEKLCAEAVSLGKNASWEQEKTRSRVLQQSWASITTQVSTEQQERFQNALSTFQQQLAIYETEQAQLAQERATQAAEQARLQAEAAALAEQVAQNEREQQEREQQAKTRERQQQQQQQAHLEETLQHLRDGLQTLDKHLEAEQYGEAIDIYHALHQRLKETTGIPHKQLAFCRNRLQALTPYIRELQDWRRWGTDQVRKQLIETADHLRNDAELDPQERARKVQSLRDEWRKLAHMEPGQQRALWKTFDASVTAAYEPSKQHFNEQAQQRETNLAQRNALCAQLESMESTTDWANVVDWRQQQAEVNRLRTQWKETGTVSHKDWKTVNQRFNAAMDALETHFQSERQRNWQERVQLVEEAKTLLEHPDTAHAIEQVKPLQARWQITLAARPADEQRLWKQFREPIDALFARSREERQQKRDEYQARQAETARQEAEQRQREQERKQQKQAELDALFTQSDLNKQVETDTATQAANQSTGESLCLQLEILLELSSPAEFQQVRMQYQLTHLSEAMLSRKETRSPIEQAMPLLKQWLALGGMPASALASQTARIETIRAAL